MLLSSISRVGPHQSRAARTASHRASLWKGFLRNATAPAWRDRWRVSSSPRAVRTTTATRERSAARCRRRSRPLIPVIRRSSTRQPVFSRSADLKNSSAEENVSTRKPRSEEHTSELQSQSNLVCRLLLEKKKKQQDNASH